MVFCEEPSFYNLKKVIFPRVAENSEPPPKHTALTCAPKMTETTMKIGKNLILVQNPTVNLVQKLIVQTPKLVQNLTSQHLSINLCRLVG